MALPHPIPYQGSKRNLASTIGQFLPRRVETWFEPFAGSAAMTIWAAHRGLAEHYVIGDALEPIAELWRLMLADPDNIADRYEQIWKSQGHSGSEYFYRVRSRFNAERNPVDLLYLICRCVKNAIRFSSKGLFTQSVDKRRLGMHPVKMRTAISGAAAILREAAEVRSGDWLLTLARAGKNDFVYLDPPYLGTSIGRDKRYAEQMPRARLIAGLKWLREREIPFALSYDGSTGAKEYGLPLPSELGLRRMLLHAGPSSQATLSGRRALTLESLYLSPGLGLSEGSGLDRWPSPVPSASRIANR